MPEPAVVDTVILRYFLFVDRQDLLVTLLGRPLEVPRVVFDPDEGDVPESAMSELTRSMHVQRRAAADPGRLPDARMRAAMNAERLETVYRMSQRGDVDVVDLDTHELEVFASLTSTDGAKELGLHFAIQPGEAACVALAVNRGWVLATDDQDALTALEALSSGHAYERIRRLLRRAAESGEIGKEEANEIHSQMRALGFRDTEAPFL
jgi:predicted nucleic acid-binding protein